MIEEKTAGSEAVAAATQEQAVQAATGNSETLRVKVYAPFQVFYEGDAYSISAVNETGPFDILPKHYNFLCMLVPCDLVIKTVAGAEKTIKIERAFMHVKSNKTTVFVDV